MATITEIERKYDVPLGFELPDLTGVTDVVGVGEADEQRLAATYFDTPELRLARHRVVLRRRVGGTDPGWHLKLPSGEDRLEIQEPLGRSADVPAAIAHRIRALARNEPVGPVARIQTQRSQRPVQGTGGAVLALVADDVVASEALLERAEVQRWREVEVELVSGPRSLMDAIDKRLRAAGARPASSPSKLAHALGEQLRQYAAAPPKATWAGTSGSLTGYVAAQRDAVVENYSAALDNDPDAVHDMRVALRRLRATLKSYASVLAPPAGPALEGELRWLGALLGAVRDTDVMGQRLAEAIAGEPPELVVGPVEARIQQRLASSSAQARAELRAGLDSARFADLLNQLDELAQASPRKASRTRMRALAAKAVRRADRRLAAAVKPPPRMAPLRLIGHGDLALHEARKAYKRARYAVEVFRPIAGRPARRLARRLTGLQDVLGAHQDAVVTQELLRDFGMRAHAEGENAFTYGLLQARQHAEAQRQLTLLARARRRAGRARIRAFLR